MECNTAVFYDIENLNGLFSTKNKQYLHLNEVHRRLLQVEGVEGIMLQRAYADWASLSHRNLRASILQIGIEPIQVFNTNPSDRIKNAADVIMIIDVVELMMKQPDIENFVLASGDGIFAFLSKKLHEHGKRVIGCGFRQVVNSIFKSSCDYFIDLEFSDKTLISTIRGIRESLEPQPPLPTEAIENTITALPAADSQPAVEPPAKKTPRYSLPKSFPKNSISEALTNAEIEPLKTFWKDWMAYWKVKEVITAIYSDPRHEKLVLDISMLKNYIGHFVPGFTSYHFKFRKFIDFIRFCLTQSPYCVACPEGSIYKVMPRASALWESHVSQDLYQLDIVLSDDKVVHSFFDIALYQPFRFTYAFLPVSKAQISEIPADLIEAEPIEIPRIVDLEENLTDEAEMSADLVYFVRPEQQEPADSKEGEPIGIRRMIKQKMMRLFADGLLSEEEISRLQSDKYAKENFGVRQPVLREQDPNGDPRAQRLVDGKAKYWMETFAAHGKKYFVYKNWLEGRSRKLFLAWLSKIEK